MALPSHGLARIVSWAGKHCAMLGRRAPFAPPDMLPLRFSHAGYREGSRRLAPGSQAQNHPPAHVTSMSHMSGRRVVLCLAGSIYCLSVRTRARSSAVQRWWCVVVGWCWWRTRAGSKLLPGSDQAVCDGYHNNPPVAHRSHIH